MLGRRGRISSATRARRRRGESHRLRRVYGSRLIVAVVVDDGSWRLLYPRLMMYLRVRWLVVGFLDPSCEGQALLGFPHPLHRVLGTAAPIARRVHQRWTFMRVSSATTVMPQTLGHERRAAVAASSLVSLLRSFPTGGSNETCTMCMRYRRTSLVVDANPVAELASLLGHALQPVLVERFERSGRVGVGRRRRRCEAHVRRRCSIRDGVGRSSDMLRRRSVRRGRWRVVIRERCRGSRSVRCSRCRRRSLVAVSCSRVAPCRLRAVPSLPSSDDQLCSAYDGCLRAV